ncbi:hypothetical protein GcM3_094006 [Golovinomyces cichoracearum]|uniref:WHIM1 domain-containing protein n=1 Tax=Golovinomyces cichoracearum TaxID=62708 RepID=A0A420IFJ9_9PEZI|nr:hypothetical protein GcM3_094006 [Golovinomyces cichoracearum]
MSSDDSSELSSAPSDTENDIQVVKKNGLLKFFTKADSKSTSIEQEPLHSVPKRDPSPAHDYILADNPDIAFIVMFRSRFTEAFPKSLANFGPQEFEQDIIQDVPGEGAESFMCALLSLLLNRKQDVKPGHYSRALEEAIQSHKSQWAKDWENKTPLSKGATFSSMVPEQRLTLLRTLILWALSSSDVIKGIIQSSYKQQRQEDDLNQPLSVQPWGSDSERRRYFLIEGLHDTQFRVYRESSCAYLKRTWWSVASNIDELKALAEKLQTQDGSQKARLLSGKILAAIPRFEAAEEKRKRREYRTTRKQLFRRLDPEFSIYEGRTRGKRVKYTLSDEEEDEKTDLHSSRRSTRNSGTGTTTEINQPTITQSGRHVKLRQGGTYGESVLRKIYTSSVKNQLENTEIETEPYNKQTTSATISGRNGNSLKPVKTTGLEKTNDSSDSASEEEDASEQDYHVDEETCPESDFDVTGNFSGEDEDDQDNDHKRPMIKLPVSPPSPERKAATVNGITPEIETTKANLASGLRDDDLAGSGPHITKEINTSLCSSSTVADYRNSKKIQIVQSDQNSV